MGSTALTNKEEEGEEGRTGWMEDGKLSLGSDSAVPFSLPLVGPAGGLGGNFQWDWGRGGELQQEGRNHQMQCAPDFYSRTKTTGSKQFLTKRKL